MVWHENDPIEIKKQVFFACWIPLQGKSYVNTFTNNGGRKWAIIYHAIHSDEIILNIIVIECKVVSTIATDITHITKERGH